MSQNPSALVYSPTMFVNSFSGESPDEIYQGAFSSLVLMGSELVSPRRSLLMSPLILSAPVDPLVVIACFLCSRSSLWTDLDLHRHV